MTTSDNMTHFFKDYAQSSLSQKLKLKEVEFFQGNLHNEYLQLPVTVKYKYAITDHYAMALSVGGYAAYGISCGGTYKQTKWNEADNKFSYSETEHKSFKGSLQMGDGLFDETVAVCA